MKVYWLLLPLLLLGCSNLKVTPIAAGNSAKSIQQVDPEKVIILMYLEPENMSDFEKAAKIRIEGENPDIEILYDIFRNEAAKLGGEYIADFKIACASVTSMSTTMSMGAGGMWNVQTRSVTSYHYNAEGTVLRRIK